MTDLLSRVAAATAAALEDRARYPLYWRVRAIRPEWHGRRCRIVIHGLRGNRLIEFSDGELVVCPGTYLRRARDPRALRALAAELTEHLSDTTQAPERAILTRPAPQSDRKGT